MSVLHAHPHWWTYIAECNDGSYYTGLTHDLNHRLEQHNLGKGAAYTRQRRPIQLIYFEQFDNHRQAAQREIAIKKLNRTAKEKLVAEFFSAHSSLN